MSGTFIVNGDGTTTIRLEYTAPTPVVKSVISAVAENLWVEETDENGIATNPFEDASNQDELDVVDAHVREVLLNMANSFKSQKAQRAAREAAAADRYELP